MLLINLQVEDKKMVVWGFRICLNNTIKENQTKKQVKEELV